MKGIFINFFFVPHRLCGEKVFTAKTLSRKVNKGIFPLFIIYFAFNVNYSFSQNKTINSLGHFLNTATHDTTRAATLVALTEELYISNPDTVIPLCQQALAIIEKHVPSGSEGTHANKQEKHSYLTTKAAALNNIGFIYDNQGQIKEALEYYSRSLKIEEEIGNKEGIASSLNNIGLIYNNQGQIKEALDYFGRSLKIKDGIGDKQGIATSLNNIGMIYMNQGQIKEALDYYGRSLKIQEEIGDKQGIAASLNNIGAIYYNQGQIKDALDYYGRSLKIQEEIGNKQGIAQSLNNIGKIYSHQKQYEKALAYRLKGLFIRKEIGDKHGIAYSLKDIGSIYLSQRNYPLALAYSDSSLVLAKELGYPENIRNAAKLYADIYKATGNHKSGWEMYELYVQMRDSIKNKENEKAAIRQQTKYEFEKAMLVKEQEEKERSSRLAVAVARRNNLQYMGIFIGLLVVFGGVFMLGKFHLPIRAVEFSVFIAFLLLFEFTLVYLDPFLDVLTKGEPILKLLVNAVVAGIPEF